MENFSLAIRSFRASLVTSRDRKLSSTILVLGSFRLGASPALRGVAEPQATPGVHDRGAGI